MWMQRAAGFVARERRTRSLWLSLIAAIAVSPRPATAQDALTVFAASSLTEAFSALGKKLEGEQPPLKVRFEFAGTQELAKRLQTGASADVFAAADERWTASLFGSGRLETHGVIFARNRLIIITPLSNPAGIAQLKDLARPGLKLAIASDAVPLGRYTRQTLVKLVMAPGLGDDFPRQVMKNVIAQESSAEAVVGKVERGEVDAAIAYQSAVTAARADKVRGFDIPYVYNTEATYTVAAVKATAHADAARRFMELLLSPAGQAIVAEAKLVTLQETRARDSSSRVKPAARP